jgi:hypothetical protein
MCGDYVPVDHEYMTMNKDAILQRFIPALTAHQSGF